MKYKNQTGSVLAIGLVLLTAITLLAIMGIQRSGLQTKIVANLQHKEIVFNSALSEVDNVYHTVQQVSVQHLSDAYDQPGIPLPVVTNLNQNSLIQVNTNIVHISNGNTQGLPNTSRLRDKRSRGKNGAGLEQFRIASNANTPNAINSNQLVGITVASPEQ